MNFLNSHFLDDQKLTNFTQLKTKKILIINTQWNKDVVGNLTKSAQHFLRQINLKFDVITVPGAFEIALAIKHYQDQYDAFVALGVIIKGQTFHFEAIAYAVSTQLANLTLELKKPIGFGVLMVKNLKQAQQRSEMNVQNKGYEATIAALEMLLIKNGSI